MDKIIIAYEIPAENNHTRLEFPGLESFTPEAYGLELIDGGSYGNTYDVQDFQIEHFFYMPESGLIASRALRRRILDMDVDDRELQEYYRLTLKHPGTSAGNQEPQKITIRKARSDINIIQQRLAREELNGRAERDSYKKVLDLYYSKFIQVPRYLFYCALIDEVFPVLPRHVEEAAQHMIGLERKRCSMAEHIGDDKEISFKVEWEVVIANVIAIYEKARNTQPLPPPLPVPSRSSKETLVTPSPEPQVTLQP